MVQGMTLLFSIDQDCEQFARYAAGQLNGAGLQVVRSFDLQAARAAQPGYACPFHGADACTCQMIVLLVYSRGGLPVTLMIHGHDGQTRVLLVDRPGQRVDALEKTSVLRTLTPGSLNFVSQGEAPGVA